MKTSLFVKCDRCGKGNHINYILNDTDVKSACECGNQLSYSLGPEFTIGQRILERSRYEFLMNKDYNLSIVFSAMAVDCELSNLYFKWSNNIGSNISDQELEKSLRKFGNIENKIQEVSKLMLSKGFKEFIQNNREILKNIENDYPSLNKNEVAESFQQQLFWPRNRVLHLGFSGYTKNDAKRCFNIATLGLQIFDKMDEYKSKHWKK
jgi:hypothetical protein